MKVIRKLVHISDKGRSLVIPQVWLEGYRNNAIEIENVVIDIQDEQLTITPVLPEKKKK
jgi:hypothetical protein